MPRLTARSRTTARRLRRNLTDAEQLLWRHLRMRQLAGNRFRKQHPIGEFVVDFVCMERRLAIEIDGGQHAESTAYDARRTKSLEAGGYRVLRFWDSEVLQNIEGVKEEIWHALTEEKPPPP
jgi:very-short-patch-repair endonuclease